MQTPTTLQDVTLPATFGALLERLADGEIEPADAILALTRLLNAQFPPDGLSELTWHAKTIADTHADRDRRAASGDLTDDEADDARWNASFARSADALDRFSQQADEADDAGLTQPFSGE